VAPESVTALSLLAAALDRAVVAALEQARPTN
jgi:hypothetical protein